MRKLLDFASEHFSDELQRFPLNPKEIINKTAVCVLSDCCRVDLSSQSAATTEV